MNRLDARVKSIRSMENLSIVSFSFYNQTLQMMSLGLSSEVKEGSLVVLNVKATSIALAKDNKLPIIVCDMFKAGNLETIINGDKTNCSIVS